ncbi:MFS transporter [Amycolatopsis sp. CA-126428]|uniref:MFS transporter n=1 Tax=Amycolatopsis sp. CA-126428 TaxID=2073158 RepID=UPI000CD20617|nr:MFS transporter [Amycolatopsis sp. CA-126428]
MSRHDRAAPTEPKAAVYRRDGATWAAFAALFAFGILFAALGPVLPYLREIEHTSYLLGALHQVAFALGSLAAGIHASRSRTPRRPTIVVGLLAAAVSGVLLGYGRALAVTLTAAFLLSAFATAALIRLWAVLSDLHHRHRAVAMTEGEGAVSVAGIVTPAVVSACAATALGWQFSFVIAFALVAAAAIALRRTRIPDTAPAPDTARAGSAAGSTPLRTLTTVVAVVALEFTISFWAASYLHDDVGIGRDTAAGLVSVLYASNFAGRLLASRLARHLSTTAVLRLSLLTALLGTPILLATSNPLPATVGLVITGIGIGGTFPLAAALHVAASPRTADQALGQILTVASLGQVTGPLVAGTLAQLSNLRVGLLTLPAVVLMATASTRTSRRTHSPEATG